jgi:hypothetical protein
MLFSNKYVHAHTQTLGTPLICMIILMFISMLAHTQDACMKNSLLI